MARGQNLRPMFLAKCEAKWSAVRACVISLGYDIIFAVLVGGISWYVSEDQTVAIEITMALAMFFVVSAGFKVVEDIKYNLADLRDFPEDWAVALYRDDDWPVDDGDWRPVDQEDRIGVKRP
jgi:hypothetical protein